MIELTITRAALSLPDLVITGTPSAGAGAFWIPEDGLEEPEFAYRLTLMPTSRNVDGGELLAAAREMSTLPLPIYTQGTTAAELADNKAILRAAFGQFDYDVTLRANGEGDMYRAMPCSPRWGAFDSGMARVHMARASVTIPVNPPGV